MELVTDYTWIVYVSGLFAFFAAFGIGANDVANAFATSIGSKALTIKQAIFIAAIFEFLGAVTMGSNVTKTIRKGISDYECFENEPSILMYGCMNVILSVGIWLLYASKFGLPVSTTHSTVGGIIGMTMTTVGSKCVLWHESTDVFPYSKGTSAIIISWVLSPILSGIASSTLFVTLRTLCLRHENAVERIWYAYPFITFIAFFINSFFILWKGAKNASEEIDNLELYEVILVSFAISTFFSVSSIPLTHYLKKRLPNNNIEETIENTNDTNISNDIIKIDSSTEKFDYKAEEGLKYLQILTSICDAFAHGANDVANAMGPFSAIYMIHKHGEVNKKYELGNDAYWILTLGGFGIVTGLTTYGYKIINVLGTKISKITPSRGLCIELGAATVIIIGSRYGWPLSTTHCQIGATVAVALLEGKNGLNWLIFFKTCIGWILTLVIVGAISSFLSAQGLYAPCI